METRLMALTADANKRAASIESGSLAARGINLKLVARRKLPPSCNH